MNEPPGGFEVRVDREARALFVGIYHITRLPFQRYWSCFGLVES